MVRRISYTPPSSPQALPVNNPHTKIYLPSPPRELPVDVQGYSTATKVGLYILGSLVFLAVLGWLKNLVVKLDRESNNEAEKCYKIGRQFFQENKVDEAKKMFDQALGWHPSNEAIQANAYYGLGLTCGDNEAAIGYFTRAIGFGRLEQTTLSLAYIKRAACYEALNSHALALQDLEKALSCRVAGHKSAILFGFSKVEAFTKCIQAVKEAKNPEHTLQYLNFALSLLGTTRNNQYADLLYQRAICYFELTKISDALTDFEAAYGCSSDSEMKGTILFAWGQVLSLNKEPQKALEKCKEALKEAKNPENTLKYLNFALRLLDKERNDDDVADLLRQRAAIFFAGNKYQEALGDLDLALKCELKSEYLKARLTHNRGMTYLQLKNPESALKDFEAADKYQYDDVEKLELRKSNLDAMTKVRERLAKMRASTPAV